MAFPPQFREPPPELPSIMTRGVDRFSSRHHDAALSKSPAVSIPGIEHRQDVPPPLPPPRFLPMEGAPFPPYDMKDRRDYEHSFRSGMSGYGSMEPSYHDERPNLRRRDTSSTNGDEGYASYSTDSRSRDSFPTEFGLSHNLSNNRLQLQSAADLLSDNMKKRLDPIRTFERSPPSSLSSSANDLLTRRHPAVEGRFPAPLSVPMQLPIHSRATLDSSTRLKDTPIFSAVSPRSAPFAFSPSEHRSPREMADPARSPIGRFTRHNSDDTASTQCGSEYHGVEDMEIDDTSSHKRLHIEDGQESMRQKRRAAGSPAFEDYSMSGVSNQPDAVRRREVASRGSPTLRLHTLNENSSFATKSSRSNSYMSSASMPLSSITTTTSFDRRSPGAFSPGGVSSTSSTSPGTVSMSLDISPRGSISGPSPTHTRATSTAGSKKRSEITKPAGPKRQDNFMCECCPKKPKKFESAGELRAHAAEKQYGCNYCGNRFKNKNEAERHQNSLHVRRHSWSCSALSGYDRAFHESPNMPGEADICGYCGEEFSRTGQAPGGGALGGGIAPLRITDQDWEDRIEHLQVVHKFRECNSSKKFYRADHFRQHLKHSHAGLSGKWTNMLENACMIEEEPPTPQ